MQIVSYLHSNTVIDFGQILSYIARLQDTDVGKSVDEMLKESKYLFRFKAMNISSEL